MKTYSPPLPTLSPRRQLLLQFNVYISSFFPMLVYTAIHLPRVSFVFTQIGYHCDPGMSSFSLKNILPTSFPNQYIKIELILMAPYFSIVRLSQNFFLPREWTVNLFLVGRGAVKFGALYSVCPRACVSGVSF